MRFGFICRLCVLWMCALTALSQTTAQKPAAGRRSRQAEGEELEGVWSPWGEWGECSQSCGMGVSERKRQCLPPPQTPPQTWPGSAYLPPGVPNHSPVISAIRPYHPSVYPGNEGPHYGGGGVGNRQPSYPPAQPTNPNPGLPLYRSEPGVGGPNQPSHMAPFYPPANQDTASLYQPSSYPSSGSSPALSYGQSGRPSRRQPNHGPGRSEGGGSRRSVSNNRDSLSFRRSNSNIRPGQFGYGRVPYSLPLHRPSRHTRHTRRHGNATVTPALESEREGLSLSDESREGLEKRGSEGAVRGHRERNKERRRREEKEEEEEEEEGGKERADTASTSAAPARTSRPDRQDRPHRPARPAVREGSRRAGPNTHTRSYTHTTDTHRHADSHRATHTLTDTHQHRDRPGAGQPVLPPQRHTPGQVPPDRQVNRRPRPPYGMPLHQPPPAQSPADPPSHHPHSSAWQSPPHGHGNRERGVAEGNWSPQLPPGNYKCPGKEVEHRRCAGESCTGSAGASRVEQCAAFNTQEFMGRLYDWEPFTEVGTEQQCELTCRPVGYRFYVRQAERVKDGTPCVNSTANDVCVGGRCLTEGCDAVLGSGQVRDKCGVCGGGDGSCQRVIGSFHNTSVPLGYHRILDIPPGATAINITERRASPNYLALRSGTGQSVVNGRWAVDPPGEYRAGGTTFNYVRPRAGPEGQGEEQGETLSAPGPTTTLLQLFIIYHKQNPGIDYEYYIPVEKKREGERERERERPRDGGRATLREISALTVTSEDPIPAPPVSSSPSSPARWTPDRSRPRGSAPNRNARIPPRTDVPLDNQPPFVWRRGPLTDCSASCGKGSHHRVIVCVNRHTEQEVPEGRCDSASRPLPEEEPCNVHSCPPFWEQGVWSDCSVTCGRGLQQRQLQCRLSFGNRTTMVHPQRCAGLPRPDATQPCQPKVCSSWEVSSDWSSCSVDCGVGKRTRNVRCVSNQGDEVGDAECSSRLRPQRSEDCHMGPCVTNWYITDWTNTCSAECGPGIQRREVVCVTRGRGGEGGGGGDCVGEKPADMKACNGGPCVPTAMWFSGPWGQCSSPCGNGTQRRDIICVQKLGSDYTVTPASECAHLEKPSPVQTCELFPCEPQWFTTQWSACSRTCGEGKQVREVRCLSPDKQHNLDCNQDTKPPQEQVCNVLPCSPLVADENCRDVRFNCMMVVQARLCVYSYYKTACCASCTQSALRAKRH
ncbi:thrombospondin type-1 domain-containing protein 4 [Clupea harengus]|uniref:Thrombospondin type-1 domain-containing protein 4 n=1 Tax=Clupea harengus TaxID=7950 RepID=A0A6P8FZ14_CLUHA|nr:thrombospondin type-1 domain-containing protein 4 [Clupea harengus]